MADFLCILMNSSFAGLHLENVARGGQKYSFIKIGGASHKSVCDSTRPVGGSGACPLRKFLFLYCLRLNLVHSLALL